TENILDETKSGMKQGAMPVLFERLFSLPEKKVSKARVYTTACGVYRLYVNGERPDDREFAPEFTSYEKLHYYQTYDVTSLLKAGRNTLNFYVADGWYFSDQASPILGEQHPAYSVLYQLEVKFEDGTEEVFFSDGSESCGTGHVLSSDIFVGEMQDMRRKPEAEEPVLVRDYCIVQLAAQPMEPVRPMKLLPAAEVFTTPAGEKIVDFGQLLAGRARIRVDIPAGEKAVFQYFEILDKDGNYINTMFAPQQDEVVSAGEPFTHEALFTFHGFRYIKVTGIKDVRKEDFQAVLLTTQKEDAGTFECSNPQLGRLYQNVRWSQWNNMMSVPTDCPSREKAGWTGDILVYARTALTNENVTPFLTSWLKNVRADQKADGAIMITSPFEKLYDTLVRGVCAGFGDNEPTNVAGWSDAIVWVPYEMYRVTGNTLILRENFQAMEKFCGNVIEAAHSKNGGADICYDSWLFNTGFHFGEWLIPSEPVGGFEICKTSAYYVAPMFAYMSMKKMAEICCVLGEDAEKYVEAQAQMKEAIQQVLIYQGMLPEDKMGAYVLAFAFGLVPEDKKAEYRDKLLALVEKNGFCLETGFLATPFLLDVLCDLGEGEAARKVFWQEKMPGWFYEVQNGATAIWEAWNADEAKHTGRFVSFDHYAFGIVDDWIMRRLCGIDSDTPGFGHLVIAPERDGHIDWLKRSFETVHGEVRVEYEKERLTVTVPPNCTATVKWNGTCREVGSGKYVFGA
ncbi:MAG: glycoside hydrolase family 78 protein, partial [Acetatifactor muris]|nr:glycoside hydrolase family 78 protein [Acetatifactor muris]